MSSHSPQLKLQIIRAGAGTGKTTALVQNLMSRIRNYYQEKNKFPRVAVSTFTRKATRELKERLIWEAIKSKDKELIQYMSHSPLLQMATLHGIFNRLLQIHGHFIGLSPGFKIMEEKESQQLLRGILKKEILEHQRGLPLLEHYSFDEVASLVNKYIAYAGEYPSTQPASSEELKQYWLQEKEKVLQEKMTDNKRNSLLQKLDDEKNLFPLFSSLSSELSKLAEKVWQDCKQEKIERSQITMSDLEILTLELVQKKNSPAIFSQNQWDFWFVDEYQDTSFLQQKILDFLSQDSCVFLVGDPQQSIYYFRGAEASVFSKKAKDLQNMKGGKLTEQRKNFRSDAELIAFFNNFFPEPFEKMETPQKTYEKEKEVARIIWIHNSEKKADKNEIEYEEAHHRVKYFLSKGVRAENITILSRRNKKLHELAQYLKNKNIPVQLHSAGNFENKREIKDALFLLYFLLNPNNDENLIGLLRTPYCRIPDESLAKWVEKKQALNRYTPLWSICLNEGKTQNVIKKLTDFLEQTKWIGITESFQTAIESLGFIDLAYYQDPTGLREANLWKLIYQIKQYERMGSSSLWAFVDRFSRQNLGLSGGEDVYESHQVVSALETSSIQMMTVHGAKGLEFDHVILLGLCDGFKKQVGFQYFIEEKDKKRWSLCVKSDLQQKRIKSQFHQKALEKEQELEMKESDRLLYVALTRAKKTVTLVGAGKAENHSWAKRFPFFSTLQEGLVEKEQYSYFVQKIQCLEKLPSS